MSLNKYYYNMGTAKGLLVMALISIISGLAGLCVGTAIRSKWIIQASEFERCMEQYRDRENQEAAEREGRGTASEKDHEKAEEYREKYGV